MGWKFWSRQTAAGETSAPRWTKPMELPDGAGRYLVVTLKQDPDWVWGLKAVLRPRADNGAVRDLLIFDPQEASRQGLIVKGYEVLSVHPECILFEGWHDKKSGRCEIRPRSSSPAPEAAAAVTA